MEVGRLQMATGLFHSSKFLPPETFSKITDLRINRPDVPLKISRMRRRRKDLTTDGRLTLLAADHPARMVTRIGDEELRMGDRREFLSGIARVMACSPFDGLLGTADVLDDVFYLENMIRGKRSIVDGKVLIGSVNRGGLSGAAFELDDFPTGFDIEGVERFGLDGAKFLLRVDPRDSDSAKTMKYCVDVVKECNRRKISLFLEPLSVARREGNLVTEKDAAKLVKIVGMAGALGSSSTRTWLKLPYCDGFDRVAAATPLPILLLGGEASDDVAGLLNEVESAMKAGPNVRGVLLGRNLLYPPGGDPLPLAMAIHSIVHKGSGADVAERSMEKWKGKDLNVFASND
jgi:hypothetical protein